MDRKTHPNHSLGILKINNDTDIIVDTQDIVVGKFKIYNMY